MNSEASDSSPRRSDPSLWGGRFESGLAPEMEGLNRSLDLDARFWRYDIRGSRAWARALGRADVLGSDEVARLLEGLTHVEERLGREDPTSFPDEDIHSLVERLLFEEVGEVAGKLHTGRSRNDQAATDLRLWGMEVAERLDEDLVALLEALVTLAEGGLDVIVPGHTHLQQAQPVRAAHWVLSHFWPLAGDRKRLRRAGEEAAVLPLGSGALAGCPFPVDREFLRRELGFRSLSPNSMHAVADRDWIVDLCYGGSMVGIHLSRLAEDLILYASTEVGLIRLSDGYSTGSSLMPQKRNPDVAELTRGKAGRLTGNLVALLTLLKGLPSTYNRDLQEDKPPLYDTVDTLFLLLPAITGAVASAHFRPERARELLDPQLLATDLADHLVRRGVPFRTSHEVVGGLVRRAEERGIALDALPREVFAEAHPVLGEEGAGDPGDLFDWERSVDAREAPGGTARKAVEAQLESARALLASAAA